MESAAAVAAADLSRYLFGVAAVEAASVVFAAATGAAEAVAETCLAAAAADLVQSLR